MGNICRSPLAQGLFEKLAHEHWLGGLVEVDSAATHSYQTGSAPDVRGQVAARQHGFDIAAQRARKIAKRDFRRFDLIVGMDDQNAADLSAVCPDAYRERIRLLLDFAPDQSVREVPDPYNGGPEDFQRALALIEIGSRGLLEHVMSIVRPPRSFS
ncbi:MAG: low molecular weight phosphotyrosine protein phosphatase [Gammaproteobacteria bacterium]|nr:low molecular weight phosphotyrosine protein phosphatase [Gammaproteobacteria bacterium]